MKYYEMYDMRAEYRVLSKRPIQHKTQWILFVALVCNLCIVLKQREESFHRQAEGSATDSLPPLTNGFVHIAAAKGVPNIAQHSNHSQRDLPTQLKQDQAVLY